jgi:NAD(P)H-dependent flavin oxidoreductase YrpB (nitropropane dioxygenase family)
VGDADIKIAPIVSSVKACKVVLTRWLKKNNRLPDFVVIEGPKAGGHLGFKAEEIDGALVSFDDEVRNIIAYVKEFAKENGKEIPVVNAGGVFSNADVKKYLAMGADGVQLATRFVATNECDADIKFKQAYVEAKDEDAVIVKSPVGMPGRALNNNFIKNIVPKGCKVDRCFNCLNHCDPRTIPYCISKALFNAAEGDIDNGLVFCGANVGRIDKIVSVKELMDELTAD